MGWPLPLSMALSSRQCCSGRELVDGILTLGLAVHSRSQAVGICQVLLDEGALYHGEPHGRGWLCTGDPDPHSLNFFPSTSLSIVKHDWAFQDRDAQFYRFPWLEPEPTGSPEAEEELVEAMALLAQRGPDALLTMALRKP